MSRTTSTLRRWQAVSDYLERRGATYEPLEHESAWSALELATVTGYPPQQVAKSVILRDVEFVLALLPASKRLDVGRLRRILRPRGRLRLATEEEIAQEFPLMEVGAIAPVGANLPAWELIDWRLIDQDEVVFAGGDHHHSFVAPPSTVVALAHATVANLCLDGRFGGSRRSRRPCSGMSTTGSSTPRRAARLSSAVPAVSGKAAAAAPRTT